MLLFKLFKGLKNSKCAVPVIKTNNSVKFKEKNINLDKISSYFEIGGGFGSNIHLLLTNFPNDRNNTSDLSFLGSAIITDLPPPKFKFAIDAL